MANLALVLYGKRQMRLEPELYLDQPGPHELLLKTLCVGICGSDVHIYLERHRPVSSPRIIGHENTAVVEKVGQEVKGFRVGDHVAVEPRVACMKCEECRLGYTNHCTSFNSGEVKGRRGYMRKYFVHPASSCHKLSPRMNFEDKAVVQPLACVVHAVQRVNIRPGTDVLICGAGPIGNLMLQTARVYGARTTCIVDINEERLNLAGRTGCADFTYLINNDKDLKTLGKEIIALMGCQPHVVVDCSGYECAINLAVDVVKIGGTVGLFGHAELRVEIPLITCSLEKEISLLGISRYNRTFPMAIHLLSSGKVSGTAIVTHQFDLDKAQEAFEMAADRKGCKILIKF